MPNPTRMKRPSRLIAAFVGLCYGCLSLTISFQHNHALTEEVEAVVAVACASISAQTPLPTQTTLVAQTAPQSAQHCAACEWQSAQVSTALPAFTLTLTPPSASRVVTTLPRYLHLRAFPTASRAPPLAA